MMTCDKARCPKCGTEVRKWTRSFWDRWFTFAFTPQPRDVHDYEMFGRGICNAYRAIQEVIGEPVWAVHQGAGEVNEYGNGLFHLGEPDEHWEYMIFRRRRA